MEDRLSLLLEQLHNAIKDFERSLSIDVSMLDTIVADSVMSGQAQKFEFCIELSWKTIKSFLYSQHGIDSASPKMSIKKWFELGYIQYDTCELLLRAVDIRNSLSHVYRKEAFFELRAHILTYNPVFRSLYLSFK